MPARPFVANVCKCVFSGTISAHNFAIVTHFQYSGTAPTAAQLNTLAADFNSSWASDMSPLLVSNTILTAVTITDLASSLGAQGVAATARTGSNGGTTIGGNTSVLVNYPSSIRYRGGHPRSYLPAPPESELASASTISTGAQTSYTTAWNFVLSNMFGVSIGTFTTAGQCAVSYVTAGAPRVTPVVMPISQSAITVELQLASQRRRIGRK